MTTLTDLRTRLRQGLHDAGLVQRWDDDGLDRHLAHAIEELSMAMPRQASADLATASGSSTLSVAALDGLLEVVRIEYPIGVRPPSVVSWERWDDTVTLISGPAPGGDDARIRYTARHVADDTSSTLSPFEEELAVLGASGFAVLEAAAGSIDTLTTGGPAVPQTFQSWGQARLIAFRQLLHQYGKRHLRVRKPVRA